MHESETTSLRGYLRAWHVIFDVKKELPPFSHLFGFWGLAIAPLTPLVKCELIYFRTNVRIKIDLGEKNGTKFGLSINYPKVDNNNNDNNNNSLFPPIRRGHNTKEHI